MFSVLLAFSRLYITFMSYLPIYGPTHKNVKKKDETEETPFSHILCVDIPW